MIPFYCCFYQGVKEKFGKSEIGWNGTEKFLELAHWAGELATARRANQPTVG
jgi:hypothetical protein